MGTSVERFLAETERPKRPVLPTALDTFGDTSRLKLAREHAPAPDHAARVIDLEAKTGLSRDLIDRNVDEVDAEQKATALEPVQQLRQVPGLEAWLAENPHNMAVAGDDLPRLSLLEKIAIGILGPRKGLSAVFGRRAGAMESEQGRIGFQGAKNHGLTEDQEARLDELKIRMDALPKGRAMLDRMFFGSGKIVGQMSDAIPAAAVAGLAGATAGSVVPGIGTALGATFGVAAGFADYAYNVEAGHAYIDLSDIRSEQGEEIDEDTKQSIALGVGAVNGLLESVGLSFVAAPFKMAARKMVRESVKDALVRPTMRGALADFGKSYAVALTGEVSTEVAQEMSAMLGEELAKMSADGEFPTLLENPEEREKAWGRLAQIARETAEGMALLALPGASIHGSASAYSARKAEQREQYYLALGEGIAESATFKRSPLAVEQLVARGPIPTVYAPVETFDTYFQSKQIDPLAVARDLGVEREYTEAQATGGDIAIPMAKYATKIAPTEHNAYFAKELRAKPNEMNAREAADLLDAIAQAAEATEEAAPAQESSAIGVQVTQALVAAGYEQSQAASQGKLYETAFRTLGKRAGIDPVELFNRYSLTITGTETPSPAAGGPRIRLADVAARALAFRETQADLAAERETTDPYAANRDLRDAAARSAEGAFMFARTAGGALRGNLKNVSVEGLIDELAFLFEQQEMDARQGKMTIVGEEGSGVGFVNVWRGHKPGAAKALGRMAQRRKAIERVEAEIAARGVADADQQLYRRITGESDIDFDPSTFMQLPLRHGQTPPPLVQETDQDIAEPVRRRKQREATESQSVITRYMAFLNIAEDERLPAEQRETAAKKAADLEPQARAEYQKRFDTINAKLRAADPNAITYQQTAFHGSPHVFDRFSLHKIGTGEGAQAYGWGLYFASRKDVAQHYRDTLAPDNVRFVLDDGAVRLTERDATDAVMSHIMAHTDAGPRMAARIAGTVLGEGWNDRQLDVEAFVKKHGQARDHVAATRVALTLVSLWDKEGSRGRVYEVDIPEDETFLDWDKPLAEQSEHVKRALATLGVKDDPELLAEATRQREGAFDRWHKAYVAAGNQQTEETQRLYADFKASQNDELRIEAITGMAGRAIYHNLLPRRSERETSLALATAGINGIRYLDGSSRRQGEGSYNYVVFDDQLIEIKRFEQALPGGDRPKGQIHFRRGEQTEVSIELLADADLSTFLHETGHFYLDIIGDLATDSPELARDLEIIKQWVGWQDGQTAFTREQHEQFARGFEKYLAEGKAPSQELRGAFARFRAWLLDVYRNLDTLQVMLSPEVRGVFDRLLAADDEIRAAELEQGMGGLADAMRAAGVPEAQVQSIAEAEADARHAAEEFLTARTIADVRREQSEIYKARRREVRAEVAAEVNQDRDYVALALLSRGTQPDGSPLPAEFEPFKLSGDALRKDYAERTPNLMARLRSRFLYFKEGGLHPDVAAEILGYANGDEMIRALLALPDTAPQRIDALTDERMRAEDESLLTPAELPIEAMKATHNEMRAKLDQKTLEILASQDLPALKGLIRKVAGRIAPSAEVKAEAERMIARRKVNAESSPLITQRAEQKARKLATDALLKGDFQTAFDELQRARLNHELYRAAVEARDVVEKVREEVAKLFQADDKLAGRRDMDLVSAARAIAASYGLGPKDQLTDDHLEQMRKYDEDTYETLKEMVDGAKSSGTTFQDATYGEIVKMRDAIRSLWDLALRTRQIEIDGKRMDLTDVREQLQGRLRELGQPHARRGYQRAVSDFEKTKLRLMGIRAALRRVESWVDAMDSGDPNGVFRRFIWTPISEAAARYRVEKGTVLTRYLAIVKSIEDSLTWTPIAAPELDYTFQNKGELLGAVLHTGNLSNLDKLTRGRGWDPDAFRQFVTRMQREGVLTKADYDYAQSVWDLFEELKAPAQQAHRQMYGRYFDEITRNEVHTLYGTYAGGYVPARVDPFIVTNAQTRAEKEALEQGGNSFMFPSTGRGFTKRRVDEYARPLLMDLRMVPAHIDQVLRFTHLQPRVKDVGRLIHHREFRAALDAFDPAVGGDMLVPWLQRAATQRIEKRSEGWGGQAADAFFRELRRRVGMNIMVANVTNALQQFTGFWMAHVKVQPRYMRNALWAYLRSPKQVAADISEKSEFMRTRVTTQVMEVQGHIDDLLLQPTKYEAAREFARKHGYFMQAGFQNVVDVITWAGAYEQAVEAGAAERMAVRSADAAVRLTQGSFATEDVSRFETGTPFVRAFTMFYSYFNMQANLHATEFTIAARDMGLRKGAGRMFYVYLFGFMIPAVLSEVIVRAMAGRIEDEDDDGIYLDDALALFFSAQARTLSAMVPFVGPAAQAGVNAFNDKWYDDRISTSPVVSALESAVRAPKSVYDAITDDGNRKRAAKDFLTLLGLLTGLPFGAAARPVGTLVGEDESEGRLDRIRSLISGR